MEINIPDFIQTISQKFRDSGHKLYLVGGSVRNILLDKPVKDWDLTTNATPDEILRLLPEGFYDNQFGTVGLSVILNDSEESHSALQHQSQDPVVNHPREYPRWPLPATD